MFDFNKYIFHTELTVRSYECDIGGVVNNSVYLQYLEHAKCEWLKNQNLNYATLSAAGKSFVVSRLSLAFKDSLKYDDTFYICMTVRRPSLYHLEGEQDIYRSDGKLILNSTVAVVCMNGDKIEQLPQSLLDNYPLTKSYASQ